MSDAIWKHRRAILQGFVVVLCILAAFFAPIIEGATTELFVGSLAAGAMCSAWIFVTSKVDKAPQTKQTPTP